MSVRETCADWWKGAEPRDDPVLKGKRDPNDGYHIKIPRRNVGPSSTQVRTRSILENTWICYNSSDWLQLYMVRTMLESLIAEKSGGKKTLRKDIDMQHLMDIDKFHKKTFYWSYLLRFSRKTSFYIRSF